MAESLHPRVQLAASHVSRAIGLAQSLADPLLSMPLEPGVRSVGAEIVALLEVVLEDMVTWTMADPR